MKNASEIIKHTFLPHKKKIDTVKCISQLLKIYPKKVKDTIIYGYVKNNTLYVVTTNYTLVTDINSNLYRIKKLLNAIKESCDYCDGVEIENIRTVDGDKLIAKNQKLSNMNLLYEISNGEFQNPMQNPKLYQMVEEIRDIIKNSKSKHSIH
jgi:hypothetical protein